MAACAQWSREYFCLVNGNMHNSCIIYRKVKKMVKISQFPILAPSAILDLTESGFLQFHSSEDA